MRSRGVSWRTLLQICPDRSHGTARLGPRALSERALRASCEFILLFGKNSEYCSFLSASVMSSSHTFFPRSSSSGLLQKSTSQIFAGDSVLVEASATGAGSTDPTFATSCAPRHLRAEMEAVSCLDPLAACPGARPCWIL